MYTYYKKGPEKGQCHLCSEVVHGGPHACRPSHPPSSPTPASKVSRLSYTSTQSSLTLTHALPPLHQVAGLRHHRQETQTGPLCPGPSRSFGAAEELACVPTAGPPSGAGQQQPAGPGRSASSALAAAASQPRQQHELPGAGLPPLRTTPGLHRPAPTTAHFAGSVTCGVSFSSQNVGCGPGHRHALSDVSSGCW